LSTVLDESLARKRHKHKQIEAAIQFAEENGWNLRPPGKSAHCFGVLLCPHNDEKCRCGVFCQMSIWGSPRAPESFAQKIIRTVENCIYFASDDEKDV
jgi:hypothetical protein